mmetsp:Transcript_7074/g.15508  ORF Transcript_7074/g.15508 Transcript_7074/m.15508 type:complete len:241 (+) Transcript_7074:926-1648(+)
MMCTKPLDALASAVVTVADPPMAGASVSASPSNLARTMLPPAVLSTVKGFAVSFAASFLPNSRWPRRIWPRLGSASASSAVRPFFSRKAAKASFVGAKRVSFARLALSSRLTYSCLVAFVAATRVESSSMLSASSAMVGSTSCSSQLEHTPAHRLRSRSPHQLPPRTFLHVRVQKLPWHTSNAAQPSSRRWVSFSAARVSSLTSSVGFGDFSVGSADTSSASMEVSARSSDDDILYVQRE